jgi:hypothetical protein
MIQARNEYGLYSHDHHSEQGRDLLEGFVRRRTHRMEVKGKVSKCIRLSSGLV